MKKIWAWMLSLPLLATGLQANAQARPWLLFQSAKVSATAYRFEDGGTLVAIERLGSPGSLNRNSGSGPEKAEFYGIAMTIAFNCQTMTETTIDMSFYGKDLSKIVSVNAGKEDAINTGAHSYIWDNILTAHCRNEVLPDGGSFSGDILAVQKWLDDAIAKAPAGS